MSITKEKKNELFTETLKYETFQYTKIDGEINYSERFTAAHDMLIIIGMLSEYYSWSVDKIYATDLNGEWKATTVEF